MLVIIWKCSFHFSSFHSIPLHSIPIHSIPFHFIPFHSTPFHSIPFHFISFYFISFHFISFHFIPLHSIPFHSIPFHFISFYFIYFSLLFVISFYFSQHVNMTVLLVRTNTRKQTLGYPTCTIWDKLPFNLKELSIYQFSKQLKPFYCQNNTIKHNSSIFSFSLIKF